MNESSLSKAGRIFFQPFLYEESIEAYFRVFVSFSKAPRLASQTKLFYNEKQIYLGGCYADSTINLLRKNR